MMARQFMLLHNNMMNSPAMYEQVIMQEIHSVPAVHLSPQLKRLIMGTTYSFDLTINWMLAGKA